MKTEAELVKALASTVFSEAMDAADELGARRSKTAVHGLIDAMRRTSDPGVRNAIAVALRDIGDPSSAAVIVEMLCDPRTEGSRGTLLYALRAFDSRPYLRLIEDLAANGDFEDRVEAQMILDQTQRHLPNEVEPIKPSVVRRALESALKVKVVQDQPDIMEREEEFQKMLAIGA